MANIVETGIRYAGSVVARSVGVEGFRRWQRYAVENFAPPYEEYRDRKITGVFAGLTQVAMPATIEAVIRTQRKDPVFLAKFLTISAVDLASYTLLTLNTDNLPQFILYKLAANVATHVGLDVLGAAARGVNRFIQGLRPSPGTLAV